MIEASRKRAQRAAWYSQPKDPHDPRHGTASFLANHGCRCERCKSAAREEASKQRKKWHSLPKDPSDPRHGTSYFYKAHGCRCERCRSAAGDTQRMWRPVATRRPQGSAEERFWSKVDKSGDCWLWTAGEVFRVKAGQNSARTTYRRFAYELMIAAPPKGKNVDVTCGNQRCVNPEHLILKEPSA